MSLLEALRQPNALYLLQHANELLPGIHKMVACFYDDNKTQVWQLESNQEFPTPLNLSTKIPENLYKYRQFERQEWVSIEDLNFAFQNRKILQKEVFEELDNHVLILNFKNEIDHLYDCIIFYFNRDASNFGLRVRGEVLTTESKMIIGNILKQSLRVALHNRKDSEKDVNQFKSYYTILANQNRKLKEELEIFHAEAENHRLNYCQSILNNISIETAYEIILTDAAKKVLSTYKGNQESIRTGLEKAVQFAIYSSPSKTLITLEDWHLDLLDDYSAEQIMEQPVDVRYQKTFAYLNKLEEGAKSAYSQHMKLTGKNVGSSMMVPVTPPAITDAIRNHQKNIYSLFDLYPERWSLIRREFKPITNLIQNQSVVRSIKKNA